MSKRFDRRTFLRGAGTIAIALPFLEESSLAAQMTPPPPRLVTLFFGLGIRSEWQGDFSGPLEPMAGFADQMAAFSVDMPKGGGGAHCETSAAVFVGERPAAVDVAARASIDQRLRAELDPSGSTLASGLWWRRGACPAQALRVFAPDGTARSPVKRPSVVFDRLFGSYVPPDPMGMVDPEEQRRRRIKRSVLDTVLDQFNHLTGDRSPLGRGSRLKLEQHVASIREIETQLAPAEQMVGMGGAACDVPARPNDPALSNGSTTYDYDEFTYGTGNGAPELDYQDVQTVFRLHADLWALALRCDLVRFGNLMFESAGGHTNLRGTYRALGSSTDFPGSSQHDSYFHDGDANNQRLYQHFAFTNLAYFIGLLHDPAFPEENGSTVLENSTVVIGTEYGLNHSSNNCFSAVLGGGGRYARGFFTDRSATAGQLYNAILEGHGVDGGIDGGGTGEASALLA